MTPLNFSARLPLTSLTQAFPMNAPITIAFDLDGTLVDSAPDMHAAANRVLSLARRTEISLAQTRQFIGDGVPRFVERSVEASGPSVDAAALATITAEFIADYEENASNLTGTYPGVVETLEALRGRGHRLAICTNKPQTASDNLLRDLDLAKYFEVIGAGDRYPVRKPDPGHLLGLLGELNVAPAAALMVGDNENDAETARAANVRFVLVPYGYARTPLEELPATFRVESFSDILDLDLDL
jgi:phosphoglycolate phosphatase